MGSFRKKASDRAKPVLPLTVEECRTMLECDWSDEQVNDFLTDLRSILEQFLDDYFLPES